MRIRTLRAASVTAVIALGMVSSGCGSDGGPDTSALRELNAQEVLARTGEASAAQTSGSFTIEASGTGTVALALKGEGRYTTDPTYATELSFSEMSFAGQSVPGGMEMRAIDKEVFLRMPSLTELAGFDWLRTDLDTLGQAANVDFEQLLEQRRLTDPRAQLQILLSSGDVTKVGEEKIDGVNTVHYQGTVTPSEITPRQGFDAEIQEELKNWYAELGVSEISYDIWVDGDFQARRLVMTMPTDSGDLSLTMNLSDFGKPVTVEAPENATDLTEILDSLG
jgi:LppX_LprAFG lipoprotein